MRQQLPTFVQELLFLIPHYWVEMYNNNSWPTNGQGSSRKLGLSLTGPSLMLSQPICIVLMISALQSTEGTRIQIFRNPSQLFLMLSMLRFVKELIFKTPLIVQQPTMPIQQSQVPGNQTYPASDPHLTVKQTNQTLSALASARRLAPEYMMVSSLPAKFGKNSPTIMIVGTFDWRRHMVPLLWTQPVLMLIRARTTMNPSMGSITRITGGHLSLRTVCVMLKHPSFHRLGLPWHMCTQKQRKVTRVNTAGRHLAGQAHSRWAPRYVQAAIVWLFSARFISPSTPEKEARASIFGFGESLMDTLSLYVSRSRLSPQIQCQEQYEQAHSQRPPDMAGGQPRRYRLGGFGGR